MNTTQFTACLQHVAQGMIASEPRLTALDQVIGDGDHGIGIKRGFTALQTLLSAPEFSPADIGDCLLQSGFRRDLRHPVPRGRQRAGWTPRAGCRDAG